jgi:hypothetical protein
MQEFNLPSARLSAPQDEELAAYHALSGLAVAGLVGGLLSPLAMVTVLLWILPPLAVALNLLALWRIHRRAPALVGRKAALVGLVLAAVFTAAAPADWLVYRWLVRGEARQFASLWFEALRDGQPQQAHLLTIDPKHRRTFREKDWQFYRDAPRWRDDLRGYVNQPLVRTLAALGPKAQVRFYQTVDQGRNELSGNDWVQLVYAVSYDDEKDEGRKSFFVALLVERLQLADGLANWRVLRAEGGVRPEGWKQPGPGA